MRQLKLLLITLSLPSIVLLSSMRPLQAQEPCGTDALLEEQLKALGLTRDQYEQQFNERIRELRKRSPEEKRTLQDKVYKVPVVIHVMHYPEDKYNISDEAVHEQMRITNEHYKEAHANVDRIPERFEGVRAGDIGIEFHLAQRDPDGATTTGITRTEVPNKTDLYSLDRGWTNIKKYRPEWNRREYLNIWIAPPESLPEDLWGVARLPISVSGFDGAMVNTRSFGVRATNPHVFSGTKGTVFSHELGHTLNLYHTFHDFSFCSDSDFCDDTPVLDRPSFGNPLCRETSSCGSVNMIENYMDYSAEACQTMFTSCQRTRMRTTLESNEFRKYLHEKHGNKLLLLSDFMPRMGAVNTEVKIWGTLFSSTVDDDSISFGGSEYIVADRFIADTRTGLSPTTDTLVVSVPSDAQTGMISVKVLDGVPATSMQDFTTLMVSGFLPTSGAVDTEVKIWGTLFSSTVDDDSISFGGSEYIVADRFIADTRTGLSSTTDTLVVSVPSDAQTAPISVKVLDGKAVMSTQSFHVQLTVGGFMPTSGAVDTEVKIWGERFSSTVDDDSISFGGSEYIVADRFIADTRTGLSPTTDTLVVSVPSDAQTGMMSVKVLDGIPAISMQDFTILMVSGFLPTNGAVDTEVKIWGERFSSTVDDDSISFGGSEYIVADRFIADTRTGLSPTTDTLVVSVPSDAQTGMISVKVLDGIPAISMQDFTILMVSGFLPTSGAVDTEVKIWGERFSSTVDDDSISFGGSEYIVADRFIADTRTDVSPTTDTLVVSVPSGAQTGPISVRVLDGIPAVSMQDFTTLMVSGFLPTSGAVDTEVKIWGTLFSSTVDDDSISFGGSEYIVADRFIADTRTGLSSTIDTLVVSVPSDAQTGPISVMVGTEADTSDGSFTVSSRPAAFGVSLSSEGGIRVYPNPNAGQLRFVHLSSGGTYMYKVYSLVGRVLLWGRLGRAETLDVNMLADGQYVLVLQTKQGEELLRTRLLVLR